MYMQRERDLTTLMNISNQTDIGTHTIIPKNGYKRKTHTHTHIQNKSNHVINPVAAVVVVRDTPPPHTIITIHTQKHQWQKTTHFINPVAAAAVVVVVVAVVVVRCCSGALKSRRGRRTLPNRSGRRRGKQG